MIVTIVSISKETGFVAGTAVTPDGVETCRIQVTTVWSFVTFIDIDAGVKLFDESIGARTVE